MDLSLGGKVGSISEHNENGRNWLRLDVPFLGVVGKEAASFGWLNMKLLEISNAPRTKSWSYKTEREASISVLIRPKKLLAGLLHKQ